MKVTFKDDQGTPTKEVEYGYDLGNRWVRAVLDADADGNTDSTRIFVHDDGQIVLDLVHDGAGLVAPSDLAHRYLWGPAVDQLLADETVDSGAVEDVAWALGDHLGSVRDLVSYDQNGTPADLTDDSVGVDKHVVYDAFGNVTSDTAPGLQSLFLYTARPFDSNSGLQNNLNRWYDASIGRWISMDPIGFAAGDANLYRYVGNGVLVNIDPNGWIKIDKSEIAGGGSIFPDRKSMNMLGAAYRFWEWTNAEPLILVQRVTAQGYFSVSHECGTSFVTWSESYLEAWMRSWRPGRKDSVTDNHLGSPKKPAEFVNSFLRRRFAKGGSTGLVLRGRSSTGQWEVYSWSFEMTAKFEMSLGMHPNWTILPLPDRPKLPAASWNHDFNAIWGTVGGDGLVTCIRKGAGAEV